MPCRARGIATIAMMSAWDRYWFGPVAAIRPYLAMKIVFCLLAFDVWTHRVPFGWRYGVDGFSVAHFQWLDVLQPLPSPGVYVGLMLSVGLLALVCALTDPGRWARALLALTFTYGWAMSLLNVYQHHYLLSLILVAFVFFPRLRAVDLYRAAVPAAPNGRPPREPLAVARPTVSAWAYALLGTTLAIVYAFTALTKLDAEWRTGLLIQRLATSPLISIEAWAERQSMPAGVFWETQALSGLIAEIVVAVGYLLAPRLDDRGGRWLRPVTGLAFLAAIAFHVGAEFLLGLDIGWFSYYMVAFACVYFLPNSLLWAAGVPLARAAAWLASLRSAASPASRSATRTLPISVTLIGIAAVSGIVGGVGVELDLPGTNTVGFLIASILLGVALVAFAVGRLPDATLHVLATGLATLLMWAAIAQSSARFDYYADLGRFLQARGEHTAALEAFEQARRYQPRRP